MFCLAGLVDSDPLKTWESPQRSIQKDPPQHTLPLADWWALTKKNKLKVSNRNKGRGTDSNCKGKDRIAC